MSITRDEAQPLLRETSRAFGSTQHRMFVVDLLCVIWATVGAQIARFGSNEQSLDIGGNQRASYTLISSLLIVVWWIVLGAGGSREERVIGYGPEEYRRVITSTLWLFGAVAIVSYVFQLDTARGYVAIALPLGIISLLAGRWIVRATLVSSRQQGRGLQRVLLIGGPHATRHLHRQLSTHPEAGYLPVAAHVPSSALDTIQTDVGTLPVVGHGNGLDDVFDAIQSSEATAVAITAGTAFDPATLRQLGWHLAALNVGMIMAPALTDVAGPRIRTQPVAGLPLIHVTTPKLQGSKRILKRSFDIAVAAVVLTLLAAPMALVAILIRIDSPGSAVFRQKRVGRAGEAFEMYKFRSMVIGAEARLDALRLKNEGSGLLFKMKQDPRITRIGRVIRKYSIDELPQLFNVLRGEMSLVGPRPPLPSEVVGYDDYAHRRLLVKPGITGLWQVSGRSNLSWEDSLRLDLYYVENWSLTQDLLILVRTIRAVVTRNGAY